MRKWLCMLITLCLLLCAVGCASVGENVVLNSGMDSGISDDSVAPSMPSSVAPTTEGTAGKSDSEAWTTAAATTVAKAEWAVEEREPMESYVASADAVLDASGAIIVSPAPGKPSEPQVGAGMLTAGEWKDLEDIPFWQKVLNNNDWYELMECRQLFTNHIVTVKVADANGAACFNVPVLLKDESGAVIYRAVTDIDGMAYLLYDLDNRGQAAKSVTVGGKDHAIAAQGVTEITADAVGIEAKQLDLLFMVDTTGSMSDELRYLQAELRDVIRRISQSGEAYVIHLSVNFYRDTGDEYVVRSFEFTSDIEKAIGQLNEQSADGGGDYPEAVHTALKDVVANHQWRKDAVKLCFMVLDAPPHSSSEIQGIDEGMRTVILSMAEQGIRLIPIASSGVNTETEFLLRSWAVMTGGTYTFLTNHSGIGGDHLEPTIGEYEVEKLNDLLVRVILEYCGK